jgi:hypothetical protein
LAAGANAALDVAEILFEDLDRQTEITPELVKLPLSLSQSFGDLLTPGLSHWPPRLKCRAHPTEPGAPVAPYVLIPVEVSSECDLLTVGRKTGKTLFTRRCAETVNETALLGHHRDNAAVHEGDLGG